MVFSICGRRLAIDDLKFAIPFSLHFCRAAVTDRDSKKRIGAFRKTESLHIVCVVAQMTDEAVEDDRAEAEVGGFQVDMLSDDAGIEFLQVIKGLLRLADENERRRLKEHMRLAELFFRFLVDGKPAAGLEVEVIPGGRRYREADQAQKLKTDAEGLLTVKWPGAGFYWINASHTDDKPSNPKAGKRRMSYTATLEVLAP